MEQRDLADAGHVANSGERLNVYSRFLNLLLPGVLKATRSRYLDIARQIEKRQFWSRQQLREWQDARLRELVAGAICDVPYYRNLALELGLEANSVRSADDLLRIPPTTKTIIQQHFPDGMTPVAGRDPDHRVVGTRGTTNRLMVIHDFDRRDHIRATGLNVLTIDAPYRFGDRRLAIPPDVCSIVCGLEGMRDSTVARHLVTMWRKKKFRDAAALSDLRGLVMTNWIECETVLEPFGADGTHIDEERLQAYLDRIAQVRPVMVMALPEYLQALAGYLERTGGPPPPVKMIRPMGANLDEVTKRRIERAFAAPVREHYGSLELGGMAFDCRNRCGMHLLEDQYVFEVVANGARVPDGELGSLLITDLYSRSMPLIRYQIGDMARITHAPCACGRTTARLTLEGRVEDTIVTSDGRFVTPERVACTLYGGSTIDQFQLIENDNGSCELRYVDRLDTRFDSNTLVELLRPLLGADRRIVVRRVRSIAPESSGKFRHVKSCSFSRILQGATQAAPEDSSSSNPGNSCHA